MANSHGLWPRTRGATADVAVVHRPAPLSETALVAVTAVLMLVLGVATIVAVAAQAPWELTVPLAAASLAVRPVAARHHRRHHQRRHHQRPPDREPAAMTRGAGSAATVSFTLSV